MAEHADSTDSELSEADIPEPAPDDGPVVGKRVSGTRTLIAVGASLVAVLGGLVGWSGFHTVRDHRDDILRTEFVEAAKRGALNLTTIDVKTVDADVQRVLDSSTGTFHDDFSKRAQPFVEVVKKAQSKSEGTVTAAALESQSGQRAEVLVSVSMTMTRPGVPDQPPQGWRMRIAVQKSGTDAKISDVQFVS